MSEAREEPTAYVIQDFEKHFMKADLRKAKRMLWVGVPTKHDSMGYCRVAAHPQAPAIYCAWQLILQVSCKMPTPGVLLNADGPLEAMDLAMLTRYPVGIFETALEVLQDRKIGWITRVALSAISDLSGQNADSSGCDPDESDSEPGASGDHPDYKQTEQTGQDTHRARAQKKSEDSPRKRFMKPTLEQWIEYAASLEPPFPAGPARDGWDHYESVGWVVGKHQTPAKSWKNCCNTASSNWRKWEKEKKSSARPNDVAAFPLELEALRK